MTVYEGKSESSCLELLLSLNKGPYDRSRHHYHSHISNSHLHRLSYINRHSNNPERNLANEFETPTRYYTLTAQVSVTINPPISTIVSTVNPETVTEVETRSPTTTTFTSETLPTTPPSWLTLTPTFTTSHEREPSTPMSSASGESGRKSSSDCHEGDENEKKTGLFSLTEEQTTTLCE